MKRNYVLIDTSKVRFTYEDYVKDCIEMEEEIYPDKSSEFYDWIDSMEQMDFDFMNEEIRRSRFNLPCMITGNLGLWNGNKEIIPVYCSSLGQAIDRCIGNSDNFTLIQKNGIIHVDSYHHDGCNKFDITILSDKGIERFRNHGKVSIRNRENVLPITDYIF